MSEPAFPQVFLPVFDALHLKNPVLLGKGGEGFVFSYDSNTVIKLYLKSRKDYLQELAELQKKIISFALPFSTPEILEIGEIHDVYYTIEKKLEGRTLDAVFPSLNEKEQYTALHKYIDAMNAFDHVEMNEYPFGQILKSGNTITADNWKTFILEKLSQRIQISLQWLKKDVLDFESKFELIQEVISKKIKCSKKKLVHGDYFLNNVLVNSNLDIAAVLDFSTHSVVGDRRLDAGSIHFLTLDKNIHSNHVNFVRDLIAKQYGYEIYPYLDIYGIYYAFYYSDLYNFDKNSYTWALGILNDNLIWDRLKNTA